MPYDYYDQLKDERNSDEYTEINDIVREKIWNESINFIISLEWMMMEDKIGIQLYYLLRYT